MTLRSALTLCGLALLLFILTGLLWLTPAHAASNASHAVGHHGRVRVQLKAAFKAEVRANKKSESAINKLAKLKLQGRYEGGTGGEDPALIPDDGPLDMAPAAPTPALCRADIPLSLQPDFCREGHF